MATEMFFPTLVGEPAVTFGGQISVLFAIRTYLPQSVVRE